MQEALTAIGVDYSGHVHGNIRRHTWIKCLYSLVLEGEKELLYILYISLQFEWCIDKANLV